MICKRRGITVLLGACVLCASFLAATTAGAAYDPLGGGHTKLRLSRSFNALLHTNGVRLAGTGGVEIEGRTVVFPVDSGKVEPVWETAIAEHAGALVFSAGPHRLPLRSLQLKTARRGAPYAAKLGGGQLKLATSPRPRATRAGFGSRFGVDDLRLTQKVAVRLDKKLHLHDAFEAGQALGSATTTVIPTTVAVAPGGKAELSLDPGFSSKLQSLFVAVNPIAPAEHPGAFTLPIGGAGTLAPDGTGGLLRTEGALEFIQVGGGQFSIKDLELEIATGQANAEYQLVLVATGAGPNQAGPLLGLGAGAFGSEPAARMISESGATLTLSQTVAQGFNEAFAKPIGHPDSFAAGEILGTIAYTATAE